MENGFHTGPNERRICNWPATRFRPGDVDFTGNESLCMPLPIGLQLAPRVALGEIRIGISRT